MAAKYGPVLCGLAAMMGLCAVGASCAAVAQEPESTARIWQKLEQPAQWSFEKTPLEIVLQTITQTSGIPLTIDQTGLADAGIDLQTRVTSRVSSISLGSGLSLLLDELDLTWSIEREGLLITTPEREEERTLTRIYNVTDLVDQVYQPRFGGGRERAPDFDSFIELISRCVHPSTWDEVGGYGSVRGYSLRGELVVAIAQTPRIHHEIADLLEELRRKTGSYSRTEGRSLRVGHAPLPSQTSHLPQTEIRPTRRQRTSLPRVYASAPAWSRPRLHD